MGHEHILDITKDSNRRTWSLTGPLVTGGTGGVRVLAPNLRESGFAVWTVRFGVQSPPSGGFNALATIDFSVNDTRITRKVSVGQGVSISGPADAISVSCVDTTPSSYANAGQDYNVTVAIAPGVRPPGPYPLLDNVSVGGTSATFVLPTSGATVTVPVPVDCGIVGAWVSAQSNNVASVTPNVSLTESSSGVTTNLLLMGLTTPMPTFVPIAPGVTSMILGNRDSTNIATASITWIVEG